MSHIEQHSVESADNPAAVGRPIGSPRNLVLAGIGLLSLLADGIPALLERSVRRGSAVVEQAQTEAERRRAAATKKTAPYVADELQSELSRRGLATHRDFEALLQQVAELEQQIDRIAAQRSAAP